MTVPFAGLTSNNGVYQYKAGGVGFVLANTVRSFSLGVASGGIGLPAPGSGTPMKHDLPLIIQVPTAQGTMVFESIIELKRTSETSSHWKR